MIPQPMPILSPTTFVMVALLLCSTPGLSQQQHEFDLDVAESYFELSGLSYIGPIVANPDHCNMGGAVGMTLDPPAGPFQGGEFAGSIFHTVPNTLYCEIPNLFSWLPPLVELEMVDAEFQLRSNPFPLNFNGAFQTMVELWPMDGYVNITPLLSQTSTYDLVTYGPSEPTSVTGTVIASQGITTLDMPLLISHGYNDQTAGVWGYITFDGSLYGQTNSQSSTFELAVSNLVGGQVGTFDIEYANQQRPAWLAYGFQTGQTWIAPLRTYLEITNPQQAGNYLLTDSSGSGQWNLPIPPAASGVTIFIQCCQLGWVSQLVAVTIQ